MDQVERWFAPLDRRAIVGVCEVWTVERTGTVREGRARCGVDGAD